MSGIYVANKEVLESETKMLQKERNHENPDKICIKEEDASCIIANICCLFRIKCLTYEKEFPRQEAFENVIASINKVDCRLIYYLRGSSSGVEFYIGIVKPKDNYTFTINDYGMMLSRAFSGNFLGSKLEKISKEEMVNILNDLRSPNVRFSSILGVPSRNTEKEDISFQGVDRLVNMMISSVAEKDNKYIIPSRLGDHFHFLVVWEPVQQEYIVEYERDLQNLYSYLSTIAKLGQQTGSSQTAQATQTTATTHAKSSTKNETLTNGLSSSSIEQETETDSISTNSTSSETHIESNVKSDSMTSGTSNNKTVITGHNVTTSDVDSLTKSESETKAKSKQHGKTVNKSTSSSSNFTDNSSVQHAKSESQQTLNATTKTESGQESLSDTDSKTNTKSASDSSKSISHQKNTIKSNAVAQNSQKSNGSSFSDTSSSSKSYSKIEGSSQSEGENCVSSSSENSATTSTQSKTLTNSTSESNSNQTSSSENKSKTSSESSTKGYNKTESQNKGEQHATGSMHGHTISENKTRSSGVGNQITDSETVTDNSGESTGHTTNISWEIQNKIVQDIMKHIDETLLPRLQRGQGKGMYNTAVYVGAETSLYLSLLENAVISICQGDKPTFTPLYVQRLQHDKASCALVSNFDIERCLEPETRLVALDSRPLSKSGKISRSTWLTSAEISMLAGLPQKEVLGLELREQVPFGLNVCYGDNENSIKLGHLKQEGGDLNFSKVIINRNDLNKHVFIAGTTGSGKTTTCHKILSSSASNSKSLPFLVIEPAKTEYRALLRDKELNNIIVFTLGNEDGVPFRFNPFEFLPTESLSSHVDILKATFMASFDMDAAIPNLLEEGLYRAYELYGWDFRDGHNKYLKNRNDAWNCGGKYFPTISSYISIVLKLVDEKQFDQRLQDEYKGSIRARLDSLRAGTKGLMFDTPLSINFEEIIKSNVILELEELKSGEDKTFIMGLVLARMLEALKSFAEREEDFRHLTFIEEAHRLLSRTQPGDSPNRKLGVETFADLLAEVRKYGESLIIVDQIPSKLTPEILKNTNTKIIHKLFSRDDKDAVGDTMALDDKQKDYLSHMGAGEAVIFSQGWNKPVNVQIEQMKNVSTTDKPIPKSMVFNSGWNYWISNPTLFCPYLSNNNLEFDINTLKLISRYAGEIRSELVLGRDLDNAWYIAIKKLQNIKYLDVRAVLKNVCFERIFVDSGGKNFPNYSTIMKWKNTILDERIDVLLSADKSNTSMAKCLFLSDIK